MDVLKRLKDYRDSGSSGIRKETKALCGEAVAVIEGLMIAAGQQRAEIERLRATQVELRAEMYGEVASRDAEIERLRAAIRWACGEEPDAEGKWFGDHEPFGERRPKPFWWRTPLRKLSGIDEQSTRQEV